MLLIHGDQDVEVDIAQSTDAAQLVAGPMRLVVVPGGIATRFIGVRYPGWIGGRAFRC